MEASTRCPECRPPRHSPRPHAQSDRPGRLSAFAADAVLAASADEPSAFGRDRARSRPAAKSSACRQCGRWCSAQRRRRNGTCRRRGVPPSPRRIAEVRTTSVSVATRRGPAPAWWRSAGRDRQWRSWSTSPPGTPARRLASSRRNRPSAHVSVTETADRDGARRQRGRGRHQTIVTRSGSRREGLNGPPHSPISGARRTPPAKLSR